MMLCWFLKYINMTRPSVYKFSLPLEPPSHLPTHPNPWVGRDQAELPESYRTSHWLAGWQTLVPTFQHYSLSSPHARTVASSGYCKDGMKVTKPLLRKWTTNNDRVFSLQNESIKLYIVNGEQSDDADSRNAKPAGW